MLRMIPAQESPQSKSSLARRRFLVLGLLCGLQAVTGSSLAPAAEPGSPKTRKIDFNREVRPLLAKNCFACHGQDEAKRAKGLRLDRRVEALKPLKSGEMAIVPGDPDSSEIIARVTHEDETLRMPPRKSGSRLTAADVDVLTRWISDGAEYAQHWALIAPKYLPIPDVKERSWPRNAIDVWILSRLEIEGLKPSPAAARSTLLRRVSLDLRGLPPTIDEFKEFLQDTAPDAYENAVDRFLGDPAYGERWARMWLDQARYADSAGFGSDPLRPTIWRYRDWVIDAFNRNLPFDQFTRQQIAGDLFANPTLDERLATAFHRNTMTNTEGGTDDEEFRVAAIKDRVDTTMQVWMGLTIGCAKCHSHKFDPITHEDYYKFYAIFNQTADQDLPAETPVIPAPTSQIRERIGQIDEEIARLRKTLASPPAGLSASTIRERIAALEKSKPAIPGVPVMVELPSSKRRVTHILRKGNFLDPGDVVEPGVPQTLHRLPVGAPKNRLGVAEWLVDPNNALTARVAVNRYWAQIFGIGLVETEEDFGTQGEPPSHPELLDWLAIRYRESGWNTKALLRMIVTSATYRQSSKVRPGLSAKDPRNRLLARAPRLRLEAEIVRDQALALSGLLSHKFGGPSVFPPQPAGLWQAAFNGERTWSTSQGDDRYRRGLYTFWRRTVPYPSMAVFDAPSREICAVRRIRTNTPLQSLVTLNDPVYVEAAQALARRIVRDGGGTVSSRVGHGLELCLGHPPRPEQAEPLIALYTTLVASYAKRLAAATALATDPFGPLSPDMPPAELAAWTAIANVLLNLDSVLTKS
jgi:Protein of unknown function (DUF1553)/Protein of unknown function (DUF1549)/Planctomycete cytochrome C